MDRIFCDRDESYRTFSLWEEKYQVFAGITTRLGGVSSKPYESLNVGFHVGDSDSAVKQNRSLLARKLSIPLNRWVVGEQPHQTAIHRVTQNEAGNGAEELSTAIQAVDGLYTDIPNLLLVSLYADCVPLYFFAEKHRLIGIAHAGWRGTVGKIGSKMLQVWKNQGVALSEIKVLIGPSIRGCCYEVDDTVMSYVNQLQLSDHCAVTMPHQRYLLDLSRLNKQLLMAAGLREDAITMATDCTSCRNDLYFSHRKENGKTGRMMAFIALSQ